MPVTRELAYRRIWLRLFAEAAAQDGEQVAAALSDALCRYGDVEVHQSGPYWKIPSYLEFNVELTPYERVNQCLALLRCLAPTGWHQDVWNRPAAGGPFLDPRIVWAWIDWEQAPNPPRFRDGEIVMIADCPAARQEGLVGVGAVVGGSTPPAPPDGSPHWSYAVTPEGCNEMICFDEPHLQPTGEHLPPGLGPPTWVSVNVNGEITGHSG